MTDLTYDPELPFAYVSPTKIYARFSDREDAEIWRERIGVGEVVDTTPKPKIPEDAEFIYYIKSGYDYYHRRLEDGTWKSDGGSPYSHSELMELVEGASEVTVLIRKEEL